MSQKIEITLSADATAETACAVGHAVWIALSRRHDVLVAFGAGIVQHRAEASPVPPPAAAPATPAHDPAGDVYVTASLNQNCIVSAKCIPGSPAHARAVKAARKMWPNHAIESLRIAELAEREAAGKKILMAEGLPAI